MAAVVREAATRQNSNGSPRATTPVPSDDDVAGCLPEDWWRDESVLASAFPELIPGFDSIGSFAVPYARLPPRLSAYAHEFPKWADLGDQTPGALLSRPKLGASAVLALIQAAERAVMVRQETADAGKVGVQAAVTRLVAQLDRVDREILAGLVWPIEPRPTAEVAEILDVHPISVRRKIPRASARFDELLADPAHLEVAEHASELGSQLGPYVPVDVVDLELRRLGIAPDSQAARILLHVAGPYAASGQWVESTASAPGGRAAAAAAVDEVFDRGAAPHAADLLRALTDVGIPTGIALTYLETHVTLRRFGDVCVRWTGDTTVSMVEAALHALGTPAPAEDILATIGPKSTVSLEKVKHVLLQQSRFVRATRRTWALAAWGIPEYLGVVPAIGACIDDSGGKVHIDDLVGDLLARYPDITESSIRTCVGALEFVTERGLVRRRKRSDGWPSPPPLNTARGVFRNGVNEIRMTMPVTVDLLRGSGQSIRPTVAAAAGVAPGGKRTFTGPDGQLTLDWRLTAASAAHTGSLRSLAHAVDAVTGDALVIAMRVNDGSLDVTRLRPDETGMERLRKLLGRRPRKPAAALAASLACPREDVGAVLRARGDHDVADLVDEG